MLCSIATLSFAPQSTPVVLNAPVAVSTRGVVPVASESPLSRRALLSSAAGAAALAVVAPLPALAESTLITRQQAYTRYVPRIERGRDFWAEGLRKMISQGNYAGILKELEPVTKTKGGAISKVFGPMRLWSSSWSGKTLSEKTLAMNEAVDELAEAASSLEVAATGKEKAGGLGGFFGGSKTMDETNRAKLAQAAYKKGVLAFNKYIEIGNDGLGLSFQPLDLID